MLVAQIMKNVQLQLSFESNQNCRPQPNRTRRVSRARWWFDRMRELVDRTPDWPTAPQSR
jgi:hypothetical protein